MMNNKIRDIYKLKQLLYAYIITVLYFREKQNRCASKKIGENRCNAFGEELKKLGDGDAKYTYGGKELDGETNLYYFNARYYDATIGRFINVDPIQDGYNWYVYCNNNPLSFIDPTGLSDKGFWKGLTFFNKKVDCTYEFNQEALKSLADGLHKSYNKLSKNADYSDTASNTNIPILSQILDFFSRVDSRNAGIVENQSSKIKDLLYQYKEKDITAKINYQMHETDVQGDYITGYYKDKDFKIFFNLIDNETGKSLLEEPLSFQYSKETVKQLEKFNSNKVNNMEEKKTNSMNFNKFNPKNVDVNDDVTIE